MSVGGVLNEYYSHISMMNSKHMSFIWRWMRAVFSRKLFTEKIVFRTCFSPFTCIWHCMRSRTRRSLDEVEFQKFWIYEVHVLSMFSQYILKLVFCVCVYSHTSTDSVQSVDCTESVVLLTQSPNRRISEILLQNFSDRKFLFFSAFWISHFCIFFFLI